MLSNNLKNVYILYIFIFRSCQKLRNNNNSLNNSRYLPGSWVFAGFSRQNVFLRYNLYIIYLYSIVFCGIDCCVMLRNSICFDRVCKHGHWQVFIEGKATTPPNLFLLIIIYKRSFYLKTSCVKML